MIKQTIAGVMLASLFAVSAFAADVHQTLTVTFNGAKALVVSADFSGMTADDLKSLDAVNQRFFKALPKNSGKGPYKVVLAGTITDDAGKITPDNDMTIDGLSLDGVAKVMRANQLYMSWLIDDAEGKAKTGKKHWGK